MPENKEPEPLPDLAGWLEYRHQQDQESIAAKTAAGLALLWPILRFDDLDGTERTWLHAVTLQVTEKFRESEQTAFEFVQGVKWAIEPTSEPLSKVTTTFPTEQFHASMRVTGPINVKRSMPAPEDAAMAKAKVASTGAGVKHALNGGRGEVEKVVQMDGRRRVRQNRAIGWKRVTDFNPCYFCAVLASRGATFLTKDSFKESNRRFTGKGDAKVHDHCQCTLAPVYRHEDKFDERARFFYNQWRKHTEGLKGAEAMKAFRRNYVPPPPREDAPVVDLDAVRANRQALIDAGFAAGSPQVRFYDRAINRLTA